MNYECRYNHLNSGNSAMLHLSDFTYVPSWRRVSKLKYFLNKSLLIPLDLLSIYLKNVFSFDSFFFVHLVFCWFFLLFFLFFLFPSSSFFSYFSFKFHLFFLLFIIINKNISFLNPSIIFSLPS